MLAAVEEQMAALALAGQSASKAFQVLAAKKADLEGLLDPVVAVANAIKKDMNKALEDSSNVIEAYGRGLITIEELRRKAGESAGKLAKDTEDLGKAFVDAGKTFTEGFVNEMIDGLGKAELSLSDFLENFVKMIAKTMTNYVVQRFFKTFADMYLAAGSSGGAFAQGAAFYNGIQKFASGGILNSPAFFSANGRLAVAGEAGPEAVVPLQRTANGDLGVSASPVNIVINNNASEVVAVQASSTDNADGSKQINVFVEHKVKTMFASGQMDRTMSSSYGLTRQPR